MLRAFTARAYSTAWSMQALAGSLGARAEASLAAGCDVALHCNGNPDEMTAVAVATGRRGDGPRLP